MSKRKRCRTNAGAQSNVFLILSCLKSQSCFLISLLSILLTYACECFKMLCSEAQISSKKEARAKNKRSKLMAEYRLVLSKDEPSSKKIKIEDRKLNDEEYKSLKKELADRKRALMHLPRFNVNASAGQQASIYETPYATRTPLLFSDIQHLLTYAYGGNELVPPPSRWCSLQKPNRLAQIIVLVVDGIGLNEFVDNEEHLNLTMSIFGTSTDSNNRGIVEFLSPYWYGETLESELKCWSVINKHEMPSTPEGFQQVIKQLSTVFPIDFENESPELPSKQDTFARNSLILTLPQLIQESYPLPIPANSSTREIQHFTPTSETYKPVHMGSRMYSIDCEMCEAEGNSQALTKIAVIDEDLNLVYESLVKPKEKITDYRTRWSGVTNEMLQPVTTTLEDVQARVREIVSESPDCILIGQSLNCDLKSMRMTHPYVIDTSVIFNLTGVEGRKSKLRDLSLNLLDEEIQKKHKNGHCPVEDSRAAMKLVKKKLATGFSFGNELKNVSQNTIMSFDPALVSSTFKQKKLDKNVLIVSQEEPPEDPTPCLKHKITHVQAPSNRQVTKAMRNNCFEHFMSVGFYKVNEQVLESDVHRCVSKLDKRINRLYSHMLSNSLLVVVSTRQDKSGSDQTRRNNGVCLIRVKSSEVPRRLD